MANRKTTHIRVYRDSLAEVRKHFPQVKTAEFFDIAIRSNPFLQAEVSIRNVTKKKQKR